MVVLRKGRLMMAHTGDCRAVLGTMVDSDEGICGQALTAVDLTRDHSLEDSITEVPRILAAGAWVRPRVDDPYTPARVYRDEHNLRKGPGLAMA